MRDGTHVDFLLGPLTRSPIGGSRARFGFTTTDFLLFGPSELQSAPALFGKRRPLADTSTGTAASRSSNSYRCIVNYRETDETVSVANTVARGEQTLGYW